MAPGISGPNGRADFTISTQNYAVCGTMKDRLKEGDILETGDWQKIELSVGSTPKTTATMNIIEGGVGFDPAPNNKEPDTRSAKLLAQQKS